MRSRLRLLRAEARMVMDARRGGGHADSHHPELTRPKLNNAGTNPELTRPELNNGGTELTGEGVGTTTLIIKDNVRALRGALRDTRASSDQTAGFAACEVMV